MVTPPGQVDESVRRQLDARFAEGGAGPEHVRRETGVAGGSRRRQLHAAARHVPGGIEHARAVQGVALLGSKGAVARVVHGEVGGERHGGARPQGALEIRRPSPADVTARMSASASIRPAS